MFPNSGGHTFSKGAQKHAQVENFKSNLNGDGDRQAREGLETQLKGYEDAHERLQKSENDHARAGRKEQAYNVRQSKHSVKAEIDKLKHKLGLA